MVKMNNKIDTVLLTIAGVALLIADTFILKYGWNNIVVTIIPVGKITAWQAFGLNALVYFIFPSVLSEKPTMDKILTPISRTIVGFILILIASFFI